VLKVGRGLAGRAGIVEGGYLLKMGQIPIFSDVKHAAGNHEKKSQEVKAGACLTMCHDEVVQRMSTNQEWPLALTFLCPPAKRRAKMVVTGKKCTTERHVSTTRFWEVERIRPYPEGPVVSPLTQNMPGIEAGYEDGVECDVTLAMGAVEIMPVADGVQKRHVGLAGGKLLEFTVESSEQRATMSGIRLRLEREGDTVEFDFKLVNSRSKGLGRGMRSCSIGSTLATEDNEMIKWVSLFKRAVDHANADLDWGDIYKRGSWAESF
jgi:hypothetical protein